MQKKWFLGKKLMAEYLGTYQRHKQDLKGTYNYNTTILKRE
jgi:hypothetical protein